MTRAAVVAFALLALAALPAAADVEVEVHYGFGGQAVAGAITPLSVRVRSREAAPLRVRIEADYRAGRSAEERWATADVLSPQAEKVFFLYGRGVRRSSPKLTLAFDRKVVVTQPAGRRFPAASSVQIEIADPPGSDSDSPAYVQVLAAGPQASLLPAVRYALRVLPVDEGALPDVWHAYEGLDVVLLRNPAEERPLDPGVQEALLEWVEAGGRLVVSATRRPDLIADTPLGRALPARLGPPVDGGADYHRIAQVLSARGRAAGPAENGPLLTLSPAPGAGSRTVTSLGPRSTVLWAEACYGLGSILVLAFDTARLARVSDTDAQALFGLLLQPAPRRADSVEAFRGLFEDYQDYELIPDRLDYPSGLIRMLRSGSLKKPPMFLLSLFMILYVLAVGPFDYAFLKRRKKLSWSALSLILIAIVFSATAWFVSFYLFAGASRLNRFTFVDVAPAADGSGMDRVRVADMAGHYEPRGNDVTLEPEGWRTAVYGPLAEPEAYMQWAGGLPGDSFDTQPVRAGAARSQFRIPFRSVRCSRATLARDEVFPLDVRFEDGATVSVRSGLPYDLKDAHLVTWRDGAPVVVPIGLIAAGASRQIPAAPVAARTLLGSSRLREAQTWNADILRDPDYEVPKFGRVLMGLTLGSCIEGPGQDGVGPVAERVLTRLAVERSGALRRGTPLLLAWTDARDPLGLGAPEEGFTITVIRRWVEP